MLLKNKFLKHNHTQNILVCSESGNARPFFWLVWKHNQIDGVNQQMLYLKIVWDKKPLQPVFPQGAADSRTLKISPCILGMLGLSDVMCR